MSCCAWVIMIRWEELVKAGIISATLLTINQPVLTVTSSIKVAIPENTKTPTRCCCNVVCSHLCDMTYYCGFISTPNWHNLRNVFLSPIQQSLYAHLFVHILVSRPYLCNSLWDFFLTALTQPSGSVDIIVSFKCWVLLHLTYFVCYISEPKLLMN